MPYIYAIYVLHVTIYMYLSYIYSKAVSKDLKKRLSDI